MKIKKLFSVLGVISLCFLLMAGCSEKSSAPSGTISPSEGAAGTAAGTPESTEASDYILPDWEYDLNVEEDMMYQYQIEDQFIPFWDRNVMYNEAACFIQEGEAVSAKLLCTPVKIVSVRDWSLQKEYVEGRDYIWDEGSKTLIRPEGSEIPFFTPGQLAGENEQGGKVPAFTGDYQADFDEQGRSRFGNVLYCVSEYLYSRQINVTYIYDPEEFNGPTALYQGDKLPRTMDKLNKGEGLNVVFYGDSIPYGCEASSMYNREPNQNTYPQLFRIGLNKIFGSRIRLRNTAVGGMTSAWGLENVESGVIQYKPDLAVILFGGNDDGIGGAQATFKNMRGMIERIQRELPECEIIIMGTIVGNEAAGFNTPTLKPLLTQGFNQIAEEYTGVVSIDIYNLHSYMLESKNYVDLSGNNINHPNDYMIRVHAMQLMATLVDFDKLQR